MKNQKIDIQKDDLGKALQDAIVAASKEFNEIIEDTLSIAANDLKQSLIQASPVDTGQLKNSWLVKMQYKRVRYVGATRVSKNDVPISNIVNARTKVIDRAIATNIQRIMNNMLTKLGGK